MRNTLPTIVEVSSSTVMLSWPSLDSVIPSNLISHYGYLVRYRLSGSSDWNISEAIPASGQQYNYSYSLGGLQFNQNYQLQVVGFRQMAGGERQQGQLSKSITAKTACVGKLKILLVGNGRGDLRALSARFPCASWSFTIV